MNQQSGQIHLEVHNLSKNFGGLQAVHNVSFEINGPELIGLIGPNGSGKSTAVKLMTGIEKPRNGEILIGEHTLSDLTVRDLAKNISVLSQNASINFPYTCLEVIQMGLYAQKNEGLALEKSDIDRIFEIMSATGTAAFAEKLITEISGGEAQRILLTRVLVQNTPFIILDEAFSGQPTCCIFLLLLTAER